jgi:hypothetical protein
MANQASQKPTGPRLPVAKDAAKLMEEGVLAMERGQWERAEKRLMAAREQLRQLDPVSWPMHRALGLVAELRLSRDDPKAAQQMKREQELLAQKLKG